MARSLAVTHADTIRDALDKTALIVTNLVAKMPATKLISVRVNVQSGGSPLQQFEYLVLVLDREPEH